MPNLGFGGLLAQVPEWVPKRWGEVQEQISFGAPFQKLFRFHLNTNLSGPFFVDTPRQVIVGPPLTSIYNQSLQGNSKTDFPPLCPLLAVT